MKNLTATDLMPFCWPSDGDSFRADLAAPFSFGDYTYASDGRIMIRVPRIAGTDVEPPAQHDLGSKVKTLEGYLRRTEFAKFKPLPSVNLPPVPPYQPQPCKECAATGRIHSVSCTKCDGTGVVTCPTCDHDDDCDRCNGVGSRDRPAKPDDDPEHVSACDECEGTGDTGDPKTEPLIFTRVGPYWIDRKYVVLLQSLQGVEIDVANEAWHVGSGGASIGNERPVLFRFDGGVGAVMPLRGKPVAVREAAE